MTRGLAPRPESVPDLATGEDLRQYLDRLIERLDLAAVVEP